MKKKVIILLILALLIAFIPLFLRKDAEFGGSDDAGNNVIQEVDSEYEPWATPLLERILGTELPGEVETLLFCIQTGIGVGVICFFMGMMVERKRHSKETSESIE